MNRFILFLVFVISGYLANSQKLYFIYLESESRQVFQARVGEKLFHSVPAGYLIIPNLVDSSYQVRISFPQNQIPELRFQIPVQGKDHGYLIKDMKDQGWVLFDLQDLVLLPPTPDTIKGSSGIQSGGVSFFREILSKAANDPSLLESPVAFGIDSAEKAGNAQISGKSDSLGRKSTASNAPSPSPVRKSSGNLPDSVGFSRPGKNKDSLPGIAANGKMPKTEGRTVVKPVGEPGKKASDTAGKKTAVVQAGTKKRESGSYKPTEVTRKSESSTTEGFGLTFVDKVSKDRNDTIRIMIPNQKPASKESAEGSQTKKKPTPAGNAESGISSSEKKNTENLAGSKSCESVASETDLIRLRRKMEAYRQVEDRINESRKVFASKCFTTVQVRSLGSLFASEAGKFQFFEAAYPFSSDRENFPALQSEFRDAYFIYRFKKMVN